MDTNLYSAISDVARHVGKDSAAEIASKVFDGRGRGNWGHKGRPGMRGGSAKGENYSMQATPAKKPTKASPGKTPAPLNVVKSLSIQQPPPYKKLSPNKADVKMVEDVKIIRSCKNPKQLANALIAAGIKTNEMQTSMFHDIRVARSFTSAALSVMSDFPQLKKRVKWFEANVVTDAYASMSIDGTTLSWCEGLTGRNVKQLELKSKQQSNPQQQYMPIYHDLPEKQMGKVIQCNFHVLGVQMYDHATTTAVHEMGHAIGAYLNDKKVDYRDIAIKAVKKAGKAYNARTIIQNVGLYACKNADETFAELFCEAYLSPKPRPAALNFKRALKKTLADMGVAHTLF